MLSISCCDPLCKRMEDDTSSGASLKPDVILLAMEEKDYLKKRKLLLKRSVIYEENYGALTLSTTVPLMNSCCSNTEASSPMAKKIPPT